MSIDQDINRTFDLMHSQIKYRTEERDEALSILKLACQDFEDKIHATEKKLGGMISWVGPDWYNKAKEIISKQK